MISTGGHEITESCVRLGFERGESFLFGEREGGDSTRIDALDVLIDEIDGADDFVHCGEDGRGFFRSVEQTFSFRFEQGRRSKNLPTKGEQIIDRGLEGGDVDVGDDSIGRSR